MEEFGRFVKEERQRQGLKVSELVNMTGLSYTTIYLFESGKIENPTIETLDLIAGALGYKLQLKAVKK